ncbi:MAG TPA: hypothetical protein VEV41_02160, partial [Terriglobales bacterium]|nr:hypothetical protein [Terriglobales bacterium]HYM08795.1 hypothetical protein [Terriglobales bacterium]HYM78141.1 hypothetical protein [Candidatus Dormibacteraeota bacterium]
MGAHLSRVRLVRAKTPRTKRRINWELYAEWKIPDLPSNLPRGLSTVATLAAARSHWEIFVQSETGPCEFAKHVTPKQRGWSALMNIIKMLEELRA